MTTHFVTPEGGEIVFKGERHRSRTLSDVLASAPLLTGDTIQLIPTGEPFKAPGGIRIVRQNHLTGRLTIRGAADATGKPSVRLAGEGIERTETGYRYPRGWLAFFLLEDLDDIEFRDLEFADCWPNAIYLNACRNVRIINCCATGGTDFVLADNTLSGSPRSAQFLLERLTWTQDPKLWRDEITWCQVKQETDPKECTRRCLNPNREYLNGAMFQGRNLDGDIEIRGCTVQDAFNGVRIKGRSSSTIERPTSVDVRIHGNRFERIRDNVTEPEKFALNWWIFDNEIVNSYATFSFDNVRGGYWYVFANRVWISDPLIDQAHCGHIEGHAYKFDQDDFPSRPWYAFHNSIQGSTPYAKEAQTRFWHSFNDAIEFARRPNPPQTLPAYFWDDDQTFCWHPSYVFRRDLSNHPDFPDGLRNHAHHYLVDGIHAERIFTDARSGDLTLAAPEGRGASLDMPIVFADGTSGVIRGGNDIGALQGRVPFRGPAFVPYKPHPWPPPSVVA